MKRIVILLSALALLLGLCAGCNRDGDPAESIADTDAQTVGSDDAEDTSTATEGVDSSETEPEADTETEAVQTEPEADTETEAVQTEPAATEGLFMIDYADDILVNYAKYDEYVIDDTAPATRAVLYTDGVVKDLKFLSLSNHSVDEYGFMHCDKTELYEHKYITADRPILITFTFYGALPAYGVSVTDAVGETVCFAITMNGEDGSLILTEIR